MSTETPIVVDHAAIAAAAMRDGLPNTVIVDGAVSAELAETESVTDVQRMQDEYAAMMNEPEPAPRGQLGPLHIVGTTVNAFSAQQRPAGTLTDELERLIDEHVERIRHALREKAREAIEREVAAVSVALERQLIYGHDSDVAEARVPADDPRPLVHQQQRDGNVARPGTCVIEAWDDGRHVHVMCGHQTSWAEGANSDASGAPREGFSCAECLAGLCEHAKAPAVESGEATFPLHE